MRANLPHTTTLHALPRLVQLERCFGRVGRGGVHVANIGVLQHVAVLLGPSHCASQRARQVVLTLLAVPDLIRRQGHVNDAACIMQRSVCRVRFLPKLRGMLTCSGAVAVDGKLLGLSLNTTPMGLRLSSST